MSSRAQRMVLIFCMATLCSGHQKGFTPPPTLAATTYAAHDGNAQEHVSVAADPYDSPQKDAQFQFPYRENGFLPVWVVITNDNDSAIALSQMTVELDFGRHARIQPASDEEVLRRMAPPKRPGPSPLQLPIPLPHRKLNSKERALYDELQQAEFAALAVEPHTTRAGFMFFDVQGVERPLREAHLIVSRILNSQGKELFYFDVPLAAAESQQPAAAN